MTNTNGGGDKPASPLPPIANPAVDGAIVVYGSARLVHALMDSELVDELRLTVYPVVLGAGRRLFGATGGRTPLQLVESRTLGRNLLFLRYVR